MDPYRFAPADQVERFQAKYVRVFTEVGATRVLDLGCGRGIFLRLLRDAGIVGVGVDISAEAVDMCRASGLRAELGDALAALQQFAAVGQLFDGIFCSHVIEHLHRDGPALLIARSAALLAPRGRLVIVTPNVENLQVITQGFWLDTSHVRFVPRLLVETLMMDAGLRIVRSGTDPETVSGWHNATFLRKILWRVALGYKVVDRHLLSGLDVYVVGERVAGKGA